MNGWEQNVVNHQNMLDEARRNGASAGEIGHYENQLAQARRDADSYNASQANQGSSGGGYTPPAEDPALKWQREQAERERRRRQDQVMATVKAAFSEFGLDSLYGEIEKWARQDLNDEAIYLKLRETQAYKDRFPAMAALSGKGRAISEKEYISFEREAARLERQFGLPEGMLGKDSVTKLLTNEVSAEELGERVVLASNATQQVPEEMRTQFQKYYGVGAGGLAAYFLDSDTAMPLLERQYASASIAGQGLIQGIDTTQAISEDLFEQGVTTDQAREGFGRVARDKALEQGKNQGVSREGLIRGTFGNENYANLINKARNAEVGQYAGGGSFVGNDAGMSGLGKASK